MADIDIDPFGEHDKTEEPTDEHIPLDLHSGASGPQGLRLPQEDQLGNQCMNKKHHSEESLKEPN